MTDRPILFQPPMVRALLADLKTNTRRILTATAPAEATSAGTTFSTETGWSNTWTWLSGDPRDADTWGVLGDFRVPYKVGDMLWVREAWRTFVSLDDVAPRDLLNGRRGAGVRYEADGMTMAVAKGGERFMGIIEPADMAPYGRVRASMHMPRWASRLTLMVTDVRVERLQEISHDDAVAEGAGIYPASMSAQKRYREIWEAINGPDSWDKNPWVVALTFTVEKAA